MVDADMENAALQGTKPNFVAQISLTNRVEQERITGHGQPLMLMCLAERLPLVIQTRSEHCSKQAADLSASSSDA